MNDYERLLAYLVDAKSDFDRRVTRNREYSPAEKLARWVRFQEQIQPTVIKLREIVEYKVYEEVMQEAQEFARLLQHKKTGAA
jgi:hypothetical protein